ncbi:NAD-dependent 5,10-methylenetetrahydrafolate dehydrogenase [Apophysomyces sp. BC1034]|nr:NAD-dependent 5,10-methylenetetrahydrafolate dehydrogenase [Apophysomyces sp. BC1015]KAG0167810.1 NAD-dependent 5,10-methylenetetrahydrafolate dehydrogenase [Apophysomyces sp. BC1021]KAG0184004.1 NAD-dependent 5,10-methylenetetrahydrafolate dehydrogenase [Apophysomyces sp. BC1034]
MSAHCKTVLASKVSASFRNQIKADIKERDVRPKLVGFLANQDPAAMKYAQWTAKTCAETGVDFELRKVDKQDLEENITEANEDKSVNGIMVYYPVFGSKQDLYLQSCVSELKDVEGLCHKFVYNVYHNIRFMDTEETMKCIIPCTPLAIVKILEFIGVYNTVLPYGNRLYGRTITVVNRSEIVGRPLAAMLSNDGAKVYSVDVNGIQVFTRGNGIHLTAHKVEDIDAKLEDVVPQSDVVITGVPTSKYKLPTSLLKDGVVAINFSSTANFEDDVKSRASIFVPSVGKVTVAMLERNLLRLYDYQNNITEQ